MTADVPLTAPPGRTPECRSSTANPESDSDRDKNRFPFAVSPYRLVPLPLSAVVRVVVKIASMTSPGFYHTANNHGRAGMSPHDAARRAGRPRPR